MEISKPSISRNVSSFYPESSNIRCACGTVFRVQSCPEGYGKKLCSNCHLAYEYWNNSDGSGLRLSVKGYFPFYPEGYTFTVTRA